MASSSTIKLPPPKYGKLTTILSIDGGGVRGIIPSVLLAKLEKQLQYLDGPEARLADYFDVISGTSTGGLVAAMLTAPNKDGRPLLAAKDIQMFYLTHCREIFPRKSWLGRKFDILFGPIYDGTPLHKIIGNTLTNNSQLSQPRLNQSLTNVVIPTFDIKTFKPVIFASNEMNNKPSLNCELKDICIGTSAAPTYLPAHYFKTEAKDGSIREFNLIGGGVLANNPTLVAMSVITKAILNVHPYFSEIVPMDYSRFLVISLGTGSAKIEQKYNAKMASKWGAIGWLLHNFSNPLLEVVMQGTVDLVELHLAAVFQALQTGDNYLRIQDDTLKKEQASIDISTKTNMENLMKIGEKLLTQPVMRLNVKTDDLEPDVHGTTNEEALRGLAEKLVNERHRRIRNQSSVDPIEKRSNLVCQKTFR